MPLVIISFIRMEYKHNFLHPLSIVILIASSLVLALTSCTTKPVVLPPNVEKAYVSAQETANELLQQAHAKISQNEDWVAEQLLQKAKKLTPGNAWIRLTLGTIYDRNGNYNQARIEYQAVLNIKNVSIFDSETPVGWRGSEPAVLATNALALLDEYPVLPSRLSSLGLSTILKRESNTSATPVDEFHSSTQNLVSTTQANNRTSTPDDARPEVIRVMENWRTAWAEGNFESYLRYYQNGFSGDKGSHKKWLLARKQVFDQMVPPIQISIEIMAFEIKEEIARVRFKQKYENKNFKDEGIKEIELVLIDGNWRISREKFFQNRN